MVYEARDDRIPFYKEYFSLAILVINIIVFIIQLLDPSGYMFIYEAAFIPSEFFAGQKLWTLVTAMFMHGDIVHIFMNMWFFYVVADNCENGLGHALFFITYMLSGFFASILHALSALFIPGMLDIPSLGASGAIFGIMAVYAILYPKNLFAIPSKYGTRRMRAGHFIFVYFASQVIYAIYAWSFSNVAYWAHIGGFIVGAIIALIFKAVKKNYREES